MSAVMLPETERNILVIGQEIKALLKVAERGSGGGGSRMGKQELVAEWLQELSSLTPPLSLCSAIFSLSWAKGERNLLLSS